MLISFLFTLQFSTNINTFLKKDQTCICAYDGFGYYMYLPALFNENTLNIDKEWAQNLQNKYCQNTEAYQLIPLPNGNYIDLYHIGLSYLQLPSYTISHIYAKTFGYKTDGFSIPYAVGFLLNALIFCIIGLFYLRKTLLLLFDEKTTSLALIILYAASNLFITFTIQKDLPHLYVFALNSIFIYHLLTFTKSKKKKNLLYSALIFGLTVAIRPTQALLGLLPLILLWKEKPNVKTIVGQILYYPFFALLWNIPQMAYWYFVGDKLFMPNLHTEELIIIDPNLLDFLFSFRKGWLLYSPVFILSFWGFIILYRKNKNLFWALFATSAIYIYIMSSWECWWYASSYGSRAMTDIYPILIIPIAFLWNHLKSIYSKMLFISISFLFIFLNQFQSNQFKKGIIHHERMSKQQYLDVFLESSTENVTGERLLMERGNKEWIESVRHSTTYSFEEKTILKFDNKLTFDENIEDTKINKIILLDSLKSDETRLDVYCKVKFLNPTEKSIYLKIETCSAFNCYDWQSIELKQNNNEFNTIEYSYNLPNIRHRDDKLQIYIINLDKVKFEIIDFEIKATTAIRN